MEINNEIISKEFNSLLNQKYILEQKNNNLILLNLNDIIQIKKDLFSDPEGIILSLEEFFESKFGYPKRLRLIFDKIPEEILFKIEDLRVTNIDEIVILKGKIAQISPVRPEAISLKFQCNVCNKELSIAQLNSTLSYPEKCSCENKEDFKMISKDFVDSQRIILEELEENALDKDSLERIDLLLKEDLTSIENRKRLVRGSKVLVIGILKDVPIKLKDGKFSKKMDYAIEVNNIFPIK